MKFNLMVLLLAAFIVIPEDALSYSHSYVSSMRSSHKSYYFFDHRIVGYQGLMKSERNPSNSQLSLYANVLEAEPENRYRIYHNDWNGKGLKSTLGIALINFVQFDLGHTYRVLSNSNNGQESLQGSSLHAGMKIFFRAPLLNIEGGIGMQASQLGARDHLATGTYYGTGTYRNLGLQYFLDSKLSFISSYSEHEERLTIDTGKDQFSHTKKMKLRSFDIGFRIWR